jgi:hypothetical protein
MSRSFTLLVLENEVVSTKKKLGVAGGSLAEVLESVRQQLSLASSISLLVHDADFDEFVQLGSLEDLPTKAKVQVICAAATAGSGEQKNVDAADGDDLR